MSRPERFSDSSTTREATSSVDTARSAGGSIARTSSPNGGSANRNGAGQQSCCDGKIVARPLPRSRPRSAFNGVKVFSATVFAERERLGERVTHWLAEHPALDIVDVKVTQSSDAAFHCLAISVFYLERSASRVTP